MRRASSSSSAISHQHQHLHRCARRSFALIHKVVPPTHTATPHLPSLRPSPSTPVFPNPSLSLPLSTPLSLPLPLHPQHSDDEVVHLRPGDHLLHRRIFHPSDGAHFAALTGDHNPLHQPHPPLTPSSPFAQPVVHGMLTASLFSTVFGSHLPGSVYLGQALRFVRPVYYGEEVEVRVEVREVRRKRARGRVGEAAAGERAEGGQDEGVDRAVVECATVVTKAGGDVVVIDGHATVLVPRVHFDASSTSPT